MKRVIAYCFSLLFIFVTTNSNSQELNRTVIEFNQEMEQDLKLKLEFFRLVMRSADRIDQKIESEKIIEHTPLGDQKIINIVREELEVMVSYYAKALSIPEAQIIKIKTAYKRIRFEKLIELYHNSKIGLEVFFKRKGIGLGLAIFAGVLSEFTVPIILTQLGLVKFVPISLVTPYALIYSFIPGMTYQWKLNRAIKDSLSNQRAFEAYKEQVKLFKKELTQVRAFDLLIPVKLNGDEYAIGVKSRNHLKKLYDLTSLNSQSLNLKNIEAFIISQKMESEFINSILAQKHLDTHLKIALVLNYVFEHGTEDQIQRFNSQFKTSLVNLSMKPYYNELLKWTMEAIKYEDPESFFSFIKLLPKETRIDEFLVVYEEMIIPNHLKNFEMSFSEARSYMHNYEIMKGKLLVLDKANSVEIFHQEVFEFISKTFRKKEANCHNPPIAILRYLKLPN